MYSYIHICTFLYILVHINRMLLHKAKYEFKSRHEVLHNDDQDRSNRYLTLMVAGEVSVIRTLDDEEIGRGVCVCVCVCVCPSSRSSMMRRFSEVIFVQV